MIDIETMGRTPDAVITAIAAARFDIMTGIIDDEFYEVVDWKRQPGRVIEPDTVSWWMEQDRAAREEFSKPGLNLDLTLECLARFIERDDMENNEIIWVNNPEFDISILTHAYYNVPMRSALYDASPPWKFWNIRDCRTLRAVAKEIVNHKDFERGEKHNALENVRYQIRYVSAMWLALKDQGPNIKRGE